MVADFGEALPFADGLTSTYTCAESAGLSDGSKAIAIADENSGDITEAYKTALAAAGFAYAPERSDDDWGYWVYLFDKHPEGETNERKVLSVQIDYYPGGTTAAAEFEINYMYYIYPVTETSAVWDAAFVKTALVDETLVQYCPEFAVASETKSYDFYDYHEYMGAGYLVVDIYGATADDVAAYIAAATAAGVGALSADDFAGSDLNTIGYTDDYAYVVEIDNYLSETVPFVRLSCVQYS